MKVFIVQKGCNSCNCLSCVETELHILWFLKIMIVVLYSRQQMPCPDHNKFFVMVLKYLRVDFWQGIDRIDQPNFHHSIFQPNLL
jgi:hypothetical protein